jgi:hypothetical protein
MVRYRTDRKMSHWVRSGSCVVFLCPNDGNVFFADVLLDDGTVGALLFDTLHRV